MWRKGAPCLGGKHPAPSPLSAAAAGAAAARAAAGRDSRDGFPGRKACRVLRPRPLITTAPVLQHELQHRPRTSVPVAYDLNASLLQNLNETAPEVQAHLASLQKFFKVEGKLKQSLLPEALKAAHSLRDIVSHAVNSKSPGLRGLQASLCSSDAVGALIQIARQGEPIGYDALQILSYRNTIACQIIVDHGVVDKVAIDMPTARVSLQSSMCYLLTALAAFNQDSHDRIAAAGLIPQLVGICRQSCRIRSLDAGQDLELDPMSLKRLEERASAVLRNLSHNTKQHANLVQAGAVDALMDIMRQRKVECLDNVCTETWGEGQTLPAEEVLQHDFKSRINAALAVAILVGHEENNSKLLMDENLVISLLSTLEAAIQGVMYQGVFWTVWKLCQGLANLTVNDLNKELITNNGGVQLMAEVLFGKHHNNEAAHRYALSTLWNLAFNDRSRATIVECPGLVEGIRNILSTTESSKTREVAKGALWTLGLEQDIKTLTDNTGHHLSHDEAVAGNGGHIMLSYEWGQQQSVMLIKSELQRAGYQTWMDVDRMSGSTLEAMAKAVEGSAIVLVCISKKYKESQACRTEAEYAFQQRKKIVPLIMESGYKPTGWLGALIGTRLYFDCSDAKTIPYKAPLLCKELGDSGRLVSKGSSTYEAPIKMLTRTPEQWSSIEVAEWLKKTGSSSYVGAFKEQDMDGMALCGLLRMSRDPRLVNEVLVAEFGMNMIGHRLRFIEELNRLFV